MKTQDCKTKCSEIKFWDVGMKFRDVGCVRISSAISSMSFSTFSTHSEWKFPLGQNGMQNPGAGIILALLWP